MKHSWMSSLILLSLIGTVWAQKSPELDMKKSLSSQAECQRVVAWGLLKPGLKVECGLDNLQFRSDVPLVPSSSGVRLGNYNLLHPGTDKTLFKDLGLTAELINQEFDVMAAVELVDVVADPAKNNLKLRPIIEQKFIPLKAVQDKSKEVASEIQKIEASISPVGPSTERPRLEDELQKARLEFRQSGLSISSKIAEIHTAQVEVDKLTKVGPIVKGSEKGKADRLKKLKAAIKKRDDLTAELVALQTQQKVITDKISSITKQLAGLSSSSISAADRIRLDGLKLEAEKLKQEESKQKDIFAQTTRYYRLPGYLRILEELRKVDASWSLVVSPHGDAAVESNTQELVGYYYRASRVTLDRNVHCSNRFKKDSVACYPNFYEDFMGDNMATLFSRRPFLATFLDGSTSFTMLAAHVVFEPPTKPADQELMLQKAFGVKALKDLPTGINKENFARFVEVLVSLQLVDKLKDEGLTHVVYTGDLNLEMKNPFWKTIFEKVPGHKILVEGGTSVSENRFVQGKESNGVASNYDHFILSSEDEGSCKNASVVNYVQSKFSQKIKNKYLVRVEAPKGPYQKVENAQSIIDPRNADVAAMLQNFNFLIVKDNAIAPDPKMTAADMKNFSERVFDSQLADETYYKVFVQTMSDHYPIRMECDFQG